MEILVKQHVYVIPSVVQLTSDNVAYWPIAAGKAGKMLNSFNLI